MSLVVRHKNTGCYLQGKGQWTPRVDAALQFNSGLKLVEFLERGEPREKPESLEIVVLSSSPEQTGGHSAA